MSQRNERSKGAELQKSVLTLVSERLKEFVNHPITPSISNEIYQMIYSVLRDVMADANAGVSNEFINFVAQHYYDNIYLNERTKLDPLIFTQRAEIANLSTGEVLLAIPLMISDVAAEELVRTLKGR